MTEREIFMAVLDLPDSAARAEYLDKVCVGDAERRVRIEALVTSHNTTDSFLGSPAVEPGQIPSMGLLTKDMDSKCIPKGDDDEGGNEDLAFLQPSIRPDSLGRLAHYEILQVLGKGGFGIVFRAFDDVLQRVVAIKVLAAQIAATSPARKRFLREARSSAKVRHENVVQVYEVAEQPLPYLVMEFIPGETLQQRLDHVGPLEGPETVHIGRQIAEALAAAHAQGLIHRDIKPGNVLLESGVNPRVKITDFGLARAADDASMTQSGMIMGTPLYMAPEQANGGKLDHRADLFSLGSVLYTMVSGRPPFRASSTLAVLTRVANDTPRPIQESIPEVPRWLCDIITKLHAKNPDERFQTAREVADLLAHCEAKLNAKEEIKYALTASAVNPSAPADKPVAPAKPAPNTARNLIAAPRRIRRSWKAVAAILMLGVFALGVTEFAGVTHLFRALPAAPTSSEPDSNSTPAVVSTNETPVLAAAKPEALPPTFTNSIGMEFVIVPKGKSWLGGGGGEPGKKEVEFKADFYLGKYKVTQDDWEKLIGNNPSQFSRTGSDSNAVKNISDADLKRFPVDNVSWDDAQLFVNVLNVRVKEAGWVYRLPTAAEWEYACRGGPMADPAASAFHFYVDKPANKLEPDQANFKYPGSLMRTSKVGSYKPNRLGLYDMHGNLWDWCEDEVKGDDGRMRRVIRGGVYHTEQNACQAANPPGGMAYAMRRGQIGIRLARVPSKVP